MEIADAVNNTQSTTESGLIRENRVWIAIIAHHTKETTGKIHSTNSRFVKFYLPDNYINNKDNAIWFYLNRLDSYSTMSDDRMINATDIEPMELVQHIPWKKISMTDTPADKAGYEKYPTAFKIM